MFEKAIVEASKYNAEFTLGFIAQKLVFYNNVELRTSVAAVEQLLKHIDHGALNEMIVSGHLQLACVDKGSWVANRASMLNEGISDRIVTYSFLPMVMDNRPFLQAHLFLDGKEIGRDGEKFYSKDYSPEKQNIIDSIEKGDGNIAHLLEDEQNFVFLYELLGNPIVLKEISNAVNRLLKLQKSSKSVSINPYYFNVVDFLANIRLLNESADIGGYRADDFPHVQLNFDVGCSADECVERIIGSVLRDFTIGTFSLLNSATKSGDLYLNTIEKVPAEILFQQCLEPAGYSELKLFQYATLGNGKAVAEAVDGGSIRFEVMNAILEAKTKHKFGKWLNSLPDDANLVKAYVDELSQLPILSRLPSKVLRYSIFGAGGLAVDALTGMPGVATASGLTLSAIDCFLIDQIESGWRPNKFVASLASNLEGG